MTDPALDGLRRCLEAAVASPERLDVAPLRALAASAPGGLDDVLREFAGAHGAAALPVLTALAADAEREVRRAAKRALYRLAQRGVRAPAAPAPRPVVPRQSERATRAWLSGVDGSGSRAVWLLFEVGYGGGSLCSLIVNDALGIVDAAGGGISRKRLERELEALRASQKLPWVETPPARALAVVAEALALHRSLGTVPPAAFSRWERLVADAPAAPAAPWPAPEPALVERSAELLELPELAGWFLEPEAVQGDALALLEARESRLVVSGQIKAEREEAIVARVIEREMTPPARGRWARRLGEMAFIFRATGRPDQAAVAEAAAAALADDGRDPTRHPFARGLARRALEVAGEVAVGHVSAEEVRRRPAGAAAGTPPRA